MGRQHSLKVRTPLFTTGYTRAMRVPSMGRCSPILRAPSLWGGECGMLIGREKIDVRTLAQTPEAMFLDHAFDGLPIHTGLPRGPAHMTMMALQEVCQELFLE